MELTGIIVIAAGVLVVALISRRIEGSFLTIPIILTAFGFLVGSGGLDLADVDPGQTGIHVLAEVTLVLVLFSDAARMEPHRLLKDHNLPLRMLLVGMPLTVIAGAVIAWSVFPENGWAVAVLTAAILTPTDAALGQAVITNPAVPVRIRQALNVESGLNDGIAFPIVLVAAIATGAMTGNDTSVAGLSRLIALQLVIGPLAGIVVGFLGAWLIDLAVDRDLLSEPFEGISILCVAALTYVGAEALGGNGFIAAFVGGLVFGGRLRHRCHFLFEFMEAEGNLLVLFAFLIFGGAMLPNALAHVSWRTLLVAISFLTVVRMVPVGISLTGCGLSIPSKLYLSWFGPRGLASILFALVIAEQHIPHGEEVLACVVTTVALSIVLHGVSAAPAAAAYSRFVAARGECEETQEITEMRLRHSR